MTIRMMGEGSSYCYLQKRHIWCTEYKVDLNVGSLAAHLKTQHVTSHKFAWEVTPPATPIKYTISFPRLDWEVTCLVEGCQVQVVIQKNLWIKFLHHHVRDTLVIIK